MNSPLFPFVCPAPVAVDKERVTLAHGEGGRLFAATPVRTPASRASLWHTAKEAGRLTRILIQEHILPVLGNEVLSPLGDSALLPRPAKDMAFTTDSFVVSPLFFPGGDIGSLAVFGTVNDLAVAGAVRCG